MGEANKCALSETTQSQRDATACSFPRLTRRLNRTGRTFAALQAATTLRQPKSTEVTSHDVGRRS
jgi:hypothetical protein